MDLYPDVFQTALQNTTLDHCPIMLNSDCERWGPASFRFELLWQEENNFSKLISDWWRELVVEGWLGQRLAVKLKLPKVKVKEWAKDNFGEVGDILHYNIKLWKSYNA